MNQYEGQQIRQFLVDLGLREADTRQADLVIINSCSVTATASAKGRQYLHSAMRINPAAILVLCGCLPPATERPAPDERTIIVTEPSYLPAQLLEVINQAANRAGIIRPEHGYTLSTLRSFSGHCRAFLKVQDGCDAHCTYCLIPRLRPKTWSKPIHQVLVEAQTLIEAGHKELILVGINLGAYGQDTVRHDHPQGPHNPHLVELICHLAGLPGLHRLRLSSLDPADIDEYLLAAMSEHANIMPHLHLPLQSGSDRLLARMGRQYNTARFLEAVAMARAYLDRPAITTDVIVGFPGETESDFQKTVELAQTVEFAKVHVFAYSPRPGTAAADMSETVPSRIIRQRCQALNQLQVQLGRQFRDQFLGHKAKVLIEATDPEPYGLSERYFKVYLEYEQSTKIEPNQILDAYLLSHHKDGLAARPLH